MQTNAHTHCHRGISNTLAQTLRLEATYTETRGMGKRAHIHEIHRSTCTHARQQRASVHCPHLSSIQLFIPPPPRTLQQACPIWRACCHHSLNAHTAHGRDCHTVVMHCHIHTCMHLHNPRLHTRMHSWILKRTYSSAHMQEHPPCTSTDPRGKYSSTMPVAMPSPSATPRKSTTFSWRPTSI